MAEIGQLFLMGGLALAVYSVMALMLGTRRRLPELVASGHTAAWAVIALSVSAFLILEYLLITQDYSVAYVVRQTTNGQPLFYTITGVWGGQEGSLLWWLCMFSCIAVVTRATTTASRRISRRTTMTSATTRLTQ